MSKTRGFGKASVIGLGYVGLPTAAVLASRGLMVTGVDISQRAVDLINSGTSHIEETDLDVVLQGVVATGRLKAVTRPEKSEVFVIAVPTPITGDKRADLDAVEAATRSIAPVLEKGNLIILESTSPVGTTQRMATILASLRPDLSFPHSRPNEADVLMAYCPERILPGQTLRELIDNSRTVGGLDQRSAERAQEFYLIFCQGHISVTTAPTAELVKLAENSYRDVNLAFANELSVLCDKWDIDVFEVIAAANRHPRVGILRPGPGVGGHCIPVDPWFIVEAFPDDARIIKTARVVNDGKSHYVFEKIKQRAARFRDPVIAMLGLSYKPDVDDLRESPALEIVELAAKARVGELLVAEPHVEALPKSLAGHDNLKLAPLKDALRAADLVVVLVAHRAFAAVPEKDLAEKAIIDTVGLWRSRIKA